MAISIDDHVSEGPSIWVDRVPKSIVDRVPQIRDINGISTWFVDGDLAFQAGYASGKEEIELRLKNSGTKGTMLRPGDWDPNERLKDYDIDGIEVALLFPNFCRFHGDPLNQIKDLDVRVECIRAYNDWLYDEFCATDAKRLKGVALLPPWDLELAMGEAVRVAKKGFKSVLWGPALDIFGYTPTWDRSWDPFYATLEDLGLILTFHQPSAATDRDYFKNPGNDIPGYIKTALNIEHTHSLIYPAAELLMSGILERFSSLQVLYAEAGASWIPFTLKQADHWWIKNSRWDENVLRMNPSEYWRRQCHSGWWSDVITPGVVRWAGEDNLMWEADYLHTLSTFPKSRQHQEESLVDITDETLREKLLRGNAAKLLGID